MASARPESDEEDAMRRRRTEVRDPEPVELAALADGSLPPSRRARLEARVAASPGLGDRLAEQQRALARMHNAVAEVAAPPSLRARIETPGRTARARGRRGTVLAGAAATLVAASALAVALLVGSHPSGERFQAALSPTALAPGARGDATLTMTSSGWRVELNAAGLPRLAGRSFYEAWLRNSAGVLVPIGTFNEPRKVTLWAGVSPRGFTTLMVTREKADGDQSSSGEKVLAGTIVRGR
jgi:anti-sigma-K factor RskA